MLYTAAGAASALVIAIAAWRRSVRQGGYYDRMEYGMEARTHLRYCAISLAFALFFTAALVFAWTIAGTVALAVFAAIAVFYGASFLRGASHDER